jgi:trimeric autotransporter adhesin
MNGAKVFNASSPLTINSAATLITANLQLTFGGNFSNSGTFTAGNSPIVITNTMATQSISGFLTTGLVSMTKTAGAATFTSNVSGSGLTINGTGGTLNLGAGLAHTFTTDFTRTAGTFNGGSSTMKFGGIVSGTGGTFVAGTGTIEYGGAAQSIVVLPYHNLALSGSGTKTFTANTTITNSLAVGSGVVANLGTGFIHTTNGLSFAGTFQISGSWGGTSSGAANINTTYFTTATGKINNNCSLPSITTQPTNPTATCSGNGTQTITVVATGSGLIYTWRKAGVALVNNAVASGQGTSSLTLTNPLSSDAGSYDVVITGTCSSSVISNTVTVSINASPTITSQPSAVTTCQNANVSFAVITSATGPTYQWQYSANPVTTWTNTNSLAGVSGHTASTLNLTSVPFSYTNRNFRCIVTSSNGCQTITTTALLTISTPTAVGTVSANQAICSGSTLDNDITISSATGTIQWQKASNATFTSNLQNIGTNLTTLSIATVGVLTSTTYFRAVVSSGGCAVAISQTITVTIATTTWSSAGGGSWSNGIPNSTKAAIISYNYTSLGNGDGSLNACSLTVNNNAVVLIKAGDNVSLNGAINVNSGSFTLESNANLIQNQDVANTGNIIVKRKTNALKRLDYVMWSSPVNSQNLLNFSPSTLTNRFYTYTTITNLYNTVVPSTTTFDAAKGYLIRVPNNMPLTPTIWTGTFTGVPRNGNYTFNLTNGGAGQRFNAVGNPYPSTIDMEQFVVDNSDAITGTLYFWRKTNSTITSPGYCTWAGGTFVSNGESQVFDPEGIIQVGQGFIVEATATGSVVEFNNSQRVTDNANQMFRTAEDEKNRMWLNLTSQSGEFYQMALGYVSDATSDVDRFDAKYYNDGPIALNTILNNTDYVIQGRALPFDENDTVPLSLTVTNAGTYTIAIDHLDGFFSEDQKIFIKDKMYGSYFNLKAGNFTFISEAGTFNNRFEIVYKNPYQSDLQTSQCGSTLTAINQNVYANLISGAQGYRFKITDLTTNQEQTIDKVLRVFQLTQLGNYTFDRTYKIEVSVKVNSIWQPYGDACTITTPILYTKIQNAQCGGQIATLNDVIYADLVSYTSGYRFRITNTQTNQSAIVDRPLRDIRLSNLINIQLSPSYIFEVAVKNTDGTYLPYGQPCTISLSTISTSKLNDATQEKELDIVAYPNPYTDSFSLKLDSKSEENITIKVYDVLGKLIENKTVDSSSIEELRIGSNYLTGIYNLIISQGEIVKTLRVIKR